VTSAAAVPLQRRLEVGDLEAQPGPYPRRAGRYTIGLAASLLLLVGLPLTAFAQAPSPDPSASGAVPESAAPAASAGSPAPATPGGPAFPTNLGGTPLDVQTYSGAGWLDEFRDGTPENEAFVADLEGLLTSLGTTLEQVTVKSALAEPSEGNQVVIMGLQVPGVPARDFAPQAVDLLLGDVEQPEFILRLVGTRWVLRVVDAAIPGVYPRTVYLDGDTAWIMGGDEDYVQDLLSQLPEQAYSTAGGEVGLASKLPVTLDDRRRRGAYEDREPLFLPAMQLRLGAALDTWLQELYLGEGLTPADLVGAIAWWGIQSSEESLEVEGYQAPGASPEVIEGLLTKVFLADGEALTDEVGRTEQELGGHQVTTLDLGYATQHVFSSGDTIWVVTDHAGEAAMAEEAIAALP
jgi:hypothetical protein